jgi:type I restriction enzyme M protein
LDQSFVPRRYYPGSFPASREIAQLMLNLTESMDSPNSDIFIPYVPYPGMPGLAGNARITCCVPNPTDAAIMAVYQLVEGGSADVQIMMPEREPGIFTRHQRFSRIIATPPGRGLRSHWSGQTDGETLCVDQIVQNLMGVQGRAAICVSPGLLFQSSRGKVLLRRNLIQRGLVEAVIMLPGGLHRSTYKASAILVLRSGKHANGKIKVINASDCKIGEERRPVLDVEKLLNRVYSTDDGEKARTVTENELVECDYDLTPARYLAPKSVSVPVGHTLVSLGEILRPADMRRAQSEDQGVVMVRKSFPDTTTGFEFSFEESPIVHASELRNGATLSWFGKITSSCLLVDTMALRGEIRAFWFSHRGRDLFLRPDMQPMEVDVEKADPSWVAMVINSQDVSRQVQAMLTGAGMPRLRVALLMNVLVALPDTLEKQKAIVRSAEELQIKAKAKEIGFEKLLNQQQENFLRDNRLKKHTLSQIARDIRSRISVVQKALKERGKLEAKQAIGRQATALCDYLDHIEARCDDMGRTLESLTKNHIFSDLEELSLEAAFKSLKTACKGRHFKLETYIHEDSFKDQETGANLDPIIHLADGDFSEVCENIFDNAERHGFQDQSFAHLIRIEAFLDAQEQAVIVSFKNTGKPLPEGLTVNRFVTPGEKGGSSGNTGIGGHHIKSLMNHAKGKIDIRNLTEDLFQVEVKLSFPFQL